MNPERQTIDNPSEDGFINAIRGVMNESLVLALQARNKRKAIRSIRKLGTRYVCHRANSPKNISYAQPPLLDPPRYLLRVA